MRNATIARFVRDGKVESTHSKDVLVGYWLMLIPGLVMIHDHQEGWIWQRDSLWILKQVIWDWLFGEVQEFGRYLVLSRALEDTFGCNFWWTASIVLLFAAWIGILHSVDDLGLSWQGPKRAVWSLTWSSWYRIRDPSGIKKRYLLKLWWGWNTRMPGLAYWPCYRRSSCHACS